MFREGQQIGSYTLIKRIGRGGFGEIWLAERRTPILTTKVAVKLPHDSQIDLETVRREAVLWEKASGHTNVLPIIEADIYDGQVVIVSEYAPDGSLADLLKKEKNIPVGKAIDLVIGITDGLEFLHSRRIIHRDLKPANILLQGDTPKLADFGISHALQTSVASQSQNIKGTFPYMSPEAFDGKRNAQTDVWSVGVILYQLLKGSLPFPQENSTALFGAIAAREPEPLPDSLPSKVKEITAKALAKLPENRYQSAKEMGEDLKKALVGIKHPTLAPTEVLDKKILPNYETNRGIEEHKSPVQEPELPPTEAFPAGENSKDISVVTEKQDSEPKLISTEAEKFANPIGDNKKKSFYYIGFIGLGLFMLLGLYGIYKLIPDNSNSTSSEVKFIPYRKGNKWGFGDEKKKIVIEPKYDGAWAFSGDGLAKVLITDNAQNLPQFKTRNGFIDKTGKEVVPLKYQFAEDFKEGLANVSLNSKYGYVDKTGKEVIPLEYDLAFPFSEGLASVLKNGQLGYIDKTGREIIPLSTKYQTARSFSDDLAVVKINGKCGFIDNRGTLVIQNKYVFAYSFKEGLAAVARPAGDGLGNNKYGFINKSDQEVISFKYDMADFFSEGLAVVAINKKYGFIDKTGNQVIPLKYDYAYSFSEGLASVKVGLKSGFIDKSGKIIIPAKFDDAYPFENGLALINLNGKFGYINHEGTEYFED